MIYKYQAYLACIQGGSRDSNEDNFYFDNKHLPQGNSGLKNIMQTEGSTEEPKVFAVFDGMGGESAGEEASLCAAEVFTEEYKKLTELIMSGKEFLLNTCHSVNACINRMLCEKKVSGMGTTVASVYLHQDEVVACNVGDSKVFRIRDGQMLMISEDHTDANIIASMGIDKKPVLLQYLGVPDNQMMLQPFVSKGDIQSGDYYIIASDGITDSISNRKLYEIVIGNSGETATRQILKAVTDNCSADNSTVIIIKIL